MPRVRSRSWSLLALLVVLATPGARAAGPRADAALAALDAAASGACSGCSALGIERRALTGSIAEYTVPVRVGPGANDRVRLHRVVQEVAPFVPVPAARALFMVHGDIWPFDGAFLSSIASAAVPDAHALPVYLAARGIDVWGIDLRWTQVPAGTTDLSFMAGWGIETDARDVRVGVAIARLTRALGGNGFNRLPLLGWSRGGQIGYAALSLESQVPSALRQIKAFIPVDIYLKSDRADLREAACLRLGINLTAQAGGAFADTSGGLLATIGNLAKSTPAGASPIVPGLNNRQVGLLTGSGTFQFLPPGGAFAPAYHFAGGTFDANGLPTGLTYQGEAGFFDFLTGTAPVESLKLLIEADAATCESSPSVAVPNVTYDDHLGDIRVPVLYVAAGGGVGDLGVHTTSLLGSTDVTSHIVSLTPPSQRLFDIGHADIFTADDAPTLFWQPIYDWLLAH
jgi:hypothetical protein